MVPIGAFAQREDTGMYLRAFVASPDGRMYVSAEEHAPDLSADPEAIGQTLARRLVAGGAREILATLKHGQ
jgi:porphobilinogen deaminase